MSLTTRLTLIVWSIIAVAASSLTVAAMPAQASTVTLTLSSCYTDVAGRTFTVDQGDVLRVEFSEPCPGSYNGNQYVGLSREAPGTLEHDITMVDANNATVATVQREPMATGQAYLVITPNAQLVRSTTSTNNAYLLAQPGTTFQQFHVRVNVPAAPEPSPSDWQPLGSGLDYRASAVVTSGSSIVVAGSFSKAGGTSVRSVARWDGTSWSSLGDGIDGEVTALATGTGGSVYAAGSFRNSGSLEISNIALWNGAAWSALGEGLDDTAYAVAATSDGVIAGGRFTRAGGTTARGIASWNGSTWQALGTGVDGTVNALAIDASGNLYAAGSFSTAGGTPASNIAMWNGTTWQALGTGINGTVNALAIDASGNLDAGGSFSTAGGTPASNIAMWNGTTWQALATGMDAAVNALAIDASGTLHAGGDFTGAGGQPADRVAAWDGSAWRAVGTGISSTVSALTFGSSGQLVAAGSFIAAGGQPAYRVAMLSAPVQPSDPTSWPRVAPQAFAVPAGTSAAECGPLAPAHVEWPGISGLRDLGWSLSYAQWPNSGAGGWVCERQPYYNGTGWQVDQR